MTQLILYEQARAALIAANDYDEVKDIRDQAEATAAYARQAKDTELIKRATEIKVRAERKCGEMLAKAEKRTGGDAMKARSNGTTELPPTLAEMGITKDQSSRYQSLASMSDDHFETAVETAKDTAGQVTTAFMLREAAKAKPHGKPKTGPKADAMRAELRNAMNSSKTQLCVYARLLIDTIEQQQEFSEQEHELLAELADAISSTRSVLQ